MRFPDGSRAKMRPALFRPDPIFRESQSRCPHYAGGVSWFAWRTNAGRVPPELRMPRPRTILRPGTKFCWPRRRGRSFSARHWSPTARHSVVGCLDDADHVTARSLQSWHGLWRIWFDLGATQQYYPLLHTAFWVKHHLWGDAVLNYHLRQLSPRPQIIEIQNRTPGTRHRRPGRNRGRGLVKLKEELALHFAPLRATLHEAASQCIGTLAGRDPRRAEGANRMVKQRLRQRRDR